VPSSFSRSSLLALTPQSPPCAQALPKALAGGNVQVIILGTGKKTYEKMVEQLDQKYPNAKGIVKFSAPLAHMITAGADFLLVPSRFEPCGLIQLHAMQYGTVPLVASTGGLVDTVKEGKTGFQMGAMDPDTATAEDADAIAATIARASEVFGTPAYEEMVVSCIQQDLSWAEPAKKWEGVIEEVVSGYSEGTQKKGEVQVPVAKV
jgi:granule-bound starch synthase